MKHYVMLLGIALLSLGACKKDKKTESVKTFADYNLQDIKDQENNFNSDPITYNAPNTNFKAGSIIFFKTNQDRYGKMQVVSVDPDVVKLTFNIVVYNPNDGTQYYERKSVELTGNINQPFDLDDSTIPQLNNVNLNLEDFVFGNSNTTFTLFFINPSDNKPKGMLFKP